MDWCIRIHVDVRYEVEVSPARIEIEGPRIPVDRECARCAVDVDQIREERELSQ